MIQNRSTRIKGIIMQIIAEVMFGLSFLFTKEATASAKPLQLLSWRFTLAAVLFWILIKIGLFKADFRGKNLKGALVLGLLHPIFYFLCENKGIALTSASESGTIIATVPIFALLFSIVFLKIKPDRNQTAGIFITLAGVLILVLSRGSQPTFNLLGYLLLFGAVIAYGLFAVKSVQIESFSSVEKAVIMIFSGAVFFTAAAVVTELAGGTFRSYILLPFTNRTFLIAILYLGIGSSIIAFTCNNYGIAALGMTASSSFAGITTLISVLAGVIFLHESFSLLQGIATLLIIAGVFIANRGSGGNA